MSISLNKQIIHITLTNNFTYAFSLPVSKSLLARRLVLAVLEERELPVWDAEDLKILPEDIRYLYQALHDFLEGKTEISVGESGTAMRLMTAFLAFKTKNVCKLFGLGRQHNRPIAPLVEALRALGADIEYLEKDGYPPLLFRPAMIKAKSIALDVSQSSQYLSALLLLAPLVQEGKYLIDTRRNKLVSAPYAFMTMDVLKEAGYHWQEDKGLFSYQGKGHRLNEANVVEADWTAASYAYALCTSLEEGAKILLPQLCLPSLQGDSLYLPKFYEHFAVATEKHPSGIIIHKSKEAEKADENETLSMDCSQCPDLVPTFVATCILHRRAFSFSGVHHLRIKECDRLAVLKRESEKVGVCLEINEDNISWNGSFRKVPCTKVELNPEGDHRMAMALAPMMAELNSEGVIIQNPEVVSKSFPNYWDNLRTFAYDILD